MRKICTYLESFKRKLKLLESPEWKPAGNLRKKWKKNSKEFKRNKIKLIKLKNRKKGKFEIPKNWNVNLKKSWEVSDELVQNYSKVNFGTVFKNNEILRKILQN